MPTPGEADQWAQALARAGQITAVLQPPATCTDRHWDYVGIRGVLAIVLQALAAQSGRAPENVSLADLVEHCARGAGHVRDLAVVVVGERLALSLDSAPDAAVPTTADRPLATWLWLTRLWPPVVPDDIDGLLPSRAPVTETPFADALQPPLEGRIPSKLRVLHTPWVSSSTIVESCAPSSRRLGRTRAALRPAL